MNSSRLRENRLDGNYAPPGPPMPARGTAL